MERSRVCPGRGGGPTCLTKWRAHGPQARRQPAEETRPRLSADVPLFPDSRPLLLGSLVASFSCVVRLTLSESCGHSGSATPVHLLCRDPSLMPLDSTWGWLCGCGARGPRGAPAQRRASGHFSRVTHKPKFGLRVLRKHASGVSRGCGSRDSGAHLVRPPEYPPGPLLCCRPRGSLPGPGGLSRFEDSCAVCWAHTRLPLPPPVPLLPDPSDQHTGWNSSRTGGFARFNNIIP